MRVRSHESLVIFHAPCKITAEAITEVAHVPPNPTTWYKLIISWFTCGLTKPPNFESENSVQRLEVRHFWDESTVISMWNIVPSQTSSAGKFVHLKLDEAYA